MWALARTRFTVSLLCASGGTAAAAPATPGASSPEAAPEVSPETIAEVVVAPEPRAPSRGASDHDIEVGQLAAVPRNDAGALLRLAPGVMLVNEGGLGHPYQIYLRGFDAREGQDIEFSLEGMPINEVGNPHGNGLVDTHFIIPELVQSLRVIEGPFAPGQGNFAVAGSVRYELGLPAPGLELRAMAGSFGTRRLLGLWRPEGSLDHTFAGAELLVSDGFGQNRAATRATAMAGYETPLGSSGALRLLGTSYASHYAQAGLLRLDDVVAGRKGFYDTNDATQGGDSTRHSLGLSVNDRQAHTELEQTAFLTLRSFRLRENLTGFLEDPQQTWQSPHPQRGDLIDQRSSTWTLAGSGRMRQQFELAGEHQELELGYFARHDQVDAVQERNRAGSIIPYRTDLELASALSNIALYADLNLQALGWLVLRGGLRADYFHYLVENRCALTEQTSFGGDPLDSECFASDRSGYRSPDQTASTAATLLEPRASLLVGPFAGLTLSASFGIGARSLDPQYINQDLETPFARVRASEVGASYVHAASFAQLSLHSTLFVTHVDRDLFFNPTEGRNTLAGGTTRRGWAGSARITGSFWDAAASTTLVDARFDDDGLAVPYAPGAVARLDASTFGALPAALGLPLEGTLGAGVSWIGARPLPFGERAAPYLLLDAGASLRWRALSLGLSVTNLLDVQYRLGEYSYVSDFGSAPYPTRVPARHFSAGEPRAAYLTLSLSLGGGQEPLEPGGPNT